MRFLTKKQVREVTTLSPTQTARLEKAGKFPKRLRATDHPRGRVVYVESEVLEWMRQRLAKRS